MGGTLALDNYSFYRITSLKLLKMFSGCAKEALSPCPAALILELRTNLCEVFKVLSCSSPSRGLLRDCEIFGNIRITFVSSSSLVAVHVGHPLEHGLAVLPAPPPRPARDLQHEQLAALHGLADGVELGEAGVAALVLAEHGPRLLVGVVVVGVLCGQVLGPGDSIQNEETQQPYLHFEATSSAAPTESKT